MGLEPGDVGQGEPAAPTTFKSHVQLHRRVYKGIPDRWRMAAWWTLIQETSARKAAKGKQRQTADDLADDYRVGRVQLYSS